MMRLPVRLTRLEAAHRDNRIVVMWRYHTETDEQAKARWLAEHPGEDLEGAGLKVIIIRWADSEPGIEAP
jgi:hypothetical protein